MRARRKFRYSVFHYPPPPRSGAGAVGPRAAPTGPTRGTERGTGQGPRGARTAAGDGKRAGPERGESSPECPAVEMTVCVGRTAPVPPVGASRMQRQRRQVELEGSLRVRAVSKLDVSRFRWIVREKARGGMTSGEIAEAMRATNAARARPAPLAMTNGEIAEAMRA